MISTDPPKGKQAGNYIAEWFGHRVYPLVSATPPSLDDQQAKRCPFLSHVTGRKTECVKRQRSKGVCTISSTSNGLRQDWLVCPFRALDRNLLDDAVRRLFGHSNDSDLMLVAAPALSDAVKADQLRAAVHAGKPCVVYFQNPPMLGGEISISPTERSPEFSFDVTLVEVVAEDDKKLALGRYGIFEIQTMDFHGTYGSAVENLRSALHLHRQDFSAAVLDHPEWLSEGVEGPNIANVFKRTFYQMMFKFQVGAHEACAGCVFAVPQSVWDSWQRHLGRPDLIHRDDGTWRLAIAESRDVPPGWIYVFDTDVSDLASPNKIVLSKAIGTDAASLSHYALDVAPAAALETGGSVDRLLDTIQIRLGRYLPELRNADLTRRIQRRRGA